MTASRSTRVVKPLGGVLGAAAASAAGFSASAAILLAAAGVAPSHRSAYTVSVIAVGVASFVWVAARIRLEIEAHAIVVRNAWRTYRIMKEDVAGIENPLVWLGLAAVTQALSPVALRLRDGRRIVIQVSLHQQEVVIPALEEALGWPQRSRPRRGGAFREGSD